MAAIEPVHTRDKETVDEVAGVPWIEPAPGEISFFEMASVLGRRKRTIFRVAVIAALAATAVAFLIPAKYAAEAVIMTPQQSQPSMSALAQLGGSGTAIGLSSLSLLSGFGLRNASDLYIGILQSRTIADALIDRFHLKQAYGDKGFYWARKHLARNTTIKAGKDTLIHIKVEDRDPERSARLANAYVEELALQNSTVAFTEASQRREFFEGQLVKEKEALADAEVALKNTEQSTGLVVPSGQAEALIRSASQLHAEILSRQAQLEGLKTYVTESNPRFQTVQRELGALRAELAKLQQGEHVTGTPDVPVGNLPQAGLEYIRKYRDVKYHETLFEALAKQYEAAKLDEAKAGAAVQIIDKAVTPERRSWPPRTLIILGGAVFAVLICCSSILIVHDPERRQQRV
ncbi:MAG: Wzz/FepE/Etk N-terminal domain-containing protein [Bryobacteraceae bacterium]